MAKIQISLTSTSAWLEADASSKLISKIGSRFSVKSGTYKQNVPAYYLHDGEELAGHVCFFLNEDLYWMDKVFLEEAYRSTGISKTFLKLALADFRKTHRQRIMVDGFYKHKQLYASLGFKAVSKTSMDKYKEDLKWHHQNFKYTHPLDEYVLMTIGGLK